MPTYEYACTNCQNQWEELQKISADPIEVCPKCGQSTAKRQISGGNFILKGGGWYADLYASTPKKGSSEAKAEWNSESKPSESSGGAGGGKESSGGAGKSDGGSASSTSTPTSMSWLTATAPMPPRMRRS